MYGLVNQGVQEMVTRQLGPEVWDQVKKKAGLDLESFEPMTAYPDEITGNLVAAASEVLDTPASEILEGFGVYWVRYTAQKGYGPLMDMSGDTLPEFLANLDQMHTRVGLAYPQLRPPGFSVHELDPHTLDLTYTSERDGLAHLVIGLIRGLGERFGTAVAIEHRVKRADGSEHDVFRIRHGHGAQ